ncbi:MAG: DUF5915 domain-containing protein, partial [Cyclobacteriaceae bacterium]
YANIDKFTYGEQEVPSAEKTESDRWITSKRYSLIKQVAAEYDNYEPTRVARLIQDFVINDLSNWYVRLNRKRFWNPSAINSGDETSKDKVAAYQTLYECLVTVAKLASPVAPFYTDHLFNDLNKVSGKESCASVHISAFPDVDASAVDLDLEERMQLAQDIASLVHSLRKQHQIKVRQPLSKILVPILHIKTRHQIEVVEDLIKTEVNVKAIEYVDDTSGILVKKIKPNFRKLGKAHGPLVKDIAAAIGQFHQEEINLLETGSTLEIHVKDQTVYLTLEDVEITSEDIPGWLVASEGGLTVALDINITEDLKKEGIARDLINRVQNLRKDMGLEVQDKINITIEKNEDLVNAALEANREYICRETQALSLDITDQIADGELVEMDDIQIKLKIRV